MNYSIVIYASILIFHLLFCKYKIKSFSSPFALYGIIWFGLLLSMQLPIIKFNPLPPIAILLISAAYIAFLIPNCFYTKKHTSAFVGEATTVNTRILRRVAYASTGIFFVLVIVYCVYVSKYFGGLKYIFEHAYDVRKEAMGKQIAPLAITYSLSIGYIAAGCGSFLLFFKKTSFFEKCVFLLPFFCAFAEDLITFSRMGTMFYAIVYFGTYLMKFCIMNKKQRMRHLKILIFLCILVVVILLIPKFIRSDGSFGSSYNTYAYYKGTSNLWGSFLHLYTYATGPLAAFGNYITEFNGVHTYGQAQLLPIFNLLYRLTGGAIPKYTVLYEFTSVPFETNIYTYLREAFDDFGYFGIILTPLYLGTVILFCNRFKLRNSYLKIALMQYVYLYTVFSVFYTPYSQGSPALGMMMYIVLIVILGKKLSCGYRNKQKIAMKKNAVIKRAR